MTAPIDIECPYCKSTSGNYCTSETTEPGIRLRVTFHHAERVDAALRATKRRQDDPRLLHAALCEALDRLAKYVTAESRDDMSFIITTREAFGP